VSTEGLARLGPYCTMLQILVNSIEIKHRVEGGILREMLSFLSPRSTGHEIPSVHHGLGVL
jgi:hypothetical protein